MQLHANDAKDPSHFNIQRHLINHENSAIENFMTKKVQQMAAENGFFYSLTVEEQTAIASVLFNMDAELTALEARRDKALALKQGMMQELLTGKIRLL